MDLVQRENSLKHTFWQNALWYAENHKKTKDLRKFLKSRWKDAEKHEINLTLEKVEQIAKILDVDDWAIFFERWD